MLRDYYLASHDNTRAVAPDILPVLPADLGAQSQGWQWTQSVGDSTRIEARAEGLVQGADGRRTDLRNAVLTIYHDDSGSVDRIKSAEMRLMDGGDLFSEGDTVMMLGIVEGGSARPAVITTRGVTFLTDENRARTDRRVHYDFDAWTGTSEGAVFDAGSGEVRMLSDVRLERRENSSADGSARIQAGSLHYSESGARIDLAGGAVVRQGDRSIECEAASIGLVDGRIEWIDGIRVSGLEESANSNSNFDTLRLRADFGDEGELLRIRGRGTSRFAADADDHRIVVRAHSVDMQYGPGSVAGRSLLRAVTANGSAIATLEMRDGQARSTLKSERLRLSLRPDSDGVEAVEALERGVLEQPQTDPDGPARVLEGNRIRLRYGERSRLESVVATGDARLLQQVAAPGAPSLRTVSERLEAVFDPESSEITEILQSGNFRFVELADGDQTQRSGEADRARFDVDGSVVTLEGAAAVSSGTSVISGRRVVMNRATGRLEAHGEATASVASASPAEGEPAHNGLFSGPQPVYTSAESIVSLPDGGTLEIRGGARLWQGESRIDADLIVLASGSSGLQASGSVRASWAETSPSDGEPSGLMTIWAQQMSFTEASGEAVFLDGVDFRREGMRVLSDELRTSPGVRRGADPDPAVATGAVRISQSVDGASARGFGDRATFLLGDPEVILTGSPARLIGPDGTETQGGSLTFRASDNSLLVLGRDGKRAYTYYPASR